VVKERICIWVAKLHTHVKIFSNIQANTLKQKNAKHSDSICATLSEWQKKLGSLKDLSDKEENNMKMCPEEHLPVSKMCAHLHHGGFLTPSIRSQCVSMGTSTLIFCVMFPSVLLLPVQPVSRHHSRLPEAQCGSTSWFADPSRETPQSGPLFVLVHQWRPILGLQWPPLVMLLGSGEPHSLIQIENNVVSLSLPRS